MSGTEIARIRNVAMVAHGGAGKTTLTEAMLFDAGVTSRLGTVEDGTTITDFDEDEVKRKTSVSSALAFCEWKGYKLNVIDTPGASIFLTDTRNCLRVLDGAVVVVSAVSGVKVQTEKVWACAEAEGLARMVYINKMDQEQADFFRALDDIRKNLCQAAIPVQLPVGAHASFAGVIDLLRMKALIYQDDLTGQCSEGEVPRELRPKAEQFRATLMEAVADSDDRLLEKYLEVGVLTDEEFKVGLRRAVIGGKVVPVLCGSAVKNIGVRPMLDLLTELFPSPVDREAMTGIDPRSGERATREGREDAPLSALVFKTLVDPYAGKISLLRVYSGVLSSDSNAYNSTKGCKERIGQVVLLRGKHQIPVQTIVAGDLGAVVKLKETSTGDTLCDERSPISLESVGIPHSIVEYAIVPKTRGDEEKMSSGLQRLREEDPSLQIRRDPQTKEIILAGMGKTHLEIAVDRLKRKYGLEIQMKTPRVPYKETIHGRTEVQGRHKKQTGGHGQYGDCWIKLEPRPRGAGYEFVNQIVGGAIPKQYIPAVEKGIIEAMEEGSLAGYPVVDVKVTLYDGSYHSVDSSEMAFKIAGSLAFKKGILQANPTLLEPIMTVEVMVPDECMGEVIGDLNSKRGRVVGVEAKGKAQTIKAQAPLAELLEYATQLKAITGDRGDYTVEFSHYDEVPPHLRERVIAELKKAKGE
ncbi:MAG: elongation factor G [Candidatus Methylomirabilis oxygeniifera]|uniref:Elongation factor G n=1 Tax=Methylomirabilis oxygeniifera TaxID=671143 RepID=D5MKJ7_METO1|nr:MAG: elongation factor G [Candidatus Methylomirabilis oxyfera]CBE67644.1 Elongation factor G (EF-G) [Candidatus Methylomirabilis oxyfera]